MTEVVRRFPLPPGPGPVTAWVAGAVLGRANELIESRNGHPLVSIELAWSQRGRTAGSARLLSGHRGLVRLNRQLFDYPDHDYLELRDTVLHEVAHLAVMATFPRAQPHGREWKWFARTLGAAPRATHRLPLLPARQVPEYGYAVADDLVWIGPVRHRRIQSGRHRYRIRRADGDHPLEARQYTGRYRRKGAT